MKSFKEYISEASFKIDMPDMPAVYVDAKSAGEVKKKLRTLLMKPMDVNVSRVNPAKVKKAFRLRAQGKDEDEEEKEKVDEIARSQTPMKNRFGKAKKDTMLVVKKGSQRVEKVPIYKGKMLLKRGSHIEAESVQAEALDKQDEPKVKEIIKKLKGASKAHAGQAKDLEKAVSEKRGRPRKDGTSDGDLENIQMQLRKSVSLRGKKDVEFADGKKKKVDDKVARKVLQMIDKYRKPQDKQNIVNYIAKSEKNLMSFASGKAKDSDMDPDAKRKKLLGIK